MKYFDIVKFNLTKFYKKYKMNHLEEKTIKTKVAHKGTFLTLNSDVVLLPNGNTSTRVWIKHPGAVCCVPILPNGKIVLIRQYRYAVKEEMIEIPAGKLDQNEIPEKCALRELEEEIGYRANKLTLLANIHPAAGFTDEKMWLYFAEDLKKTKQSLDADEFLEIIPTKLDDAVDMVWSGKITDVKTIIGILWAQRILC
jgi:ADP-ribose pyrophosphatase